MLVFKSWQELLVLIIGLCLAQPMFAETGYRYVPPNSDYGKLCVNQCDNSKYQCQQLEQLKQENKELKKEQGSASYRQNRTIELQRCMAKYANDKEKQKKKCRDEDDEAIGIDIVVGLAALFFAEDEEKRDVCQDRFLGCFKNCGGKIETVIFDSLE